MVSDACKKIAFGGGKVAGINFYLTIPKAKLDNIVVEDKKSLSSEEKMEFYEILQDEIDLPLKIVWYSAFTDNLGNCKEIFFDIIESVITRLQLCCNLKVYTDEPIETSAEVSFYLYCRKGGKAQKQEAERGCMYE